MKKIGLSLYYMLIAGAFTFLISLSPAARAYAQSAMIELNTESIVQSQYVGGALEWEPAQNYDLTDEEWNLQAERLDFMNLGFIRSMQSMFWYTKGFDAGGNPIYDFDNRYMQRLYKVLDYAQSRGITVLIGDWNGPGEGFHDYKQGPGLGPNALNANSNNSATDAFGFGDSRYAKAVAGMVNHLVNDLHYTNIKYYDLGNEVNLINIGYTNWVTAIRNLHTEFSNYGLLNQVTIVGPDGGYTGDSWLGGTLRDLGTEVGLYDLHYYPSKSEIEEGLVEKKMASVQKQVKGTFPTRDLILGEIGVGGYSERSYHVREFWYGTYIASALVQTMRAGLAGANAWSIDDATHKWSWTPNDYTDKIWGLWNSKGTEFGYAGDENMRPWYYVWSLLSKYFPKGSQIVYVTPSGIPGVYATAAKIPNGSSYDLSIAVVNTNNGAETLTIQVPNALNQPTFQQYNYFENDKPTDGNGFPTVKATLVAVDLTAGLNVTLPTQGAVILTTLNGGTPVSLNADYSGLKTPTVLTNLATGSVVTASSEESWGPKTGVNDGEYTVMWGSGPQENSWVKLDLGSSRTFNTVDLLWDVHYAVSYKVEVSTDNANWTTLYGTYRGDGGNDVIRFPVANTRYVRVSTSEASSNFGVTIDEIGIYNDTAVSPAPNPVPVPFPADLALGKSASASTVADSFWTPAAKAVDGYTTTSWQSQAGAAQWISVDLASSQTFNEVKLKWAGGQAPKSYALQTSTDGTNWTDVFQTTNGQYGSNVIAISSATAKYVRVYMSEGLTNAYQLAQFSVYNDSAAGAPTAWDKSVPPNPIGATTVDGLNDWSQAYSHSSSLQFDTSFFTKYFEYDNSRVQRSGGDTPQDLVYRVMNWSNVRVRVFGYNGVEGKLKLYSSADGTNWTELKAVHDTPVNMGGSGGNNWFRSYFSVEGGAPAGQHYLKVQLLNDPAVWSPQVGDVSISVEGDFFDELNDMNRLYAKSANVTLDNGDANLFEKDMSRIKRTSNTAGSIVYRVEDMSSFRVIAYGYQSVTGKVNFYASSDGSNWTPVASSASGVTNVGSNWYRATLQPSGKLPEGMSFLKVELLNDPAVWSPQISQVSISQDESVRAQPTLFDAMNDLTKIWAHSNQVGLDTSNASYLESDGSRLYRNGTTNTDEYVVYKTTNDLLSFRVRGFGYNGIDNKITFYASSDNQSWTAVDTTHDTPVSTAGGWQRAYFKPTGSLPAGTKYLKIKLGNDSAISSPQVGDVKLLVQKSIVDGLDDFNILYQASSGWKRDTTNAQYLEGDPSRLTRTSDTPQSVVYKSVYDMTTFRAKIFGYNGVDGKVSFYVSSDGTNWSSVSAGHDTSVSTGSSWSSANFRPSGSLPAGSRYLKIVFSNDAAVWSPQLGNVSIPTNDRYVGKTIHIQSGVNGKYFSVQTGTGGSPIAASGTAVSAAEQFLIEDAGGGFVALKSLANGKYVTYDSANAGSPLQANAAAISFKEMFWLSSAGGGLYTLSNWNNDKYVAVDTADPAYPIWANGLAVTAAMKFKLAE